MTEILITGFVGILSSIASGWLSWFYTRKKYNSEVDNNLIENMQKSLDFYKKLSDDNRERLEEVLKRNDELEDRDKKLEEEVRELRNQVFNLMGSICLDLQCRVRQRGTTQKLFGNSSEKKSL